jgi:hypothetical protein
MARVSETRYSWRTCLATMVIIPVAVMIVVVLLYIVIDNICVAEADRWLPVYPGAELVSESHEFVRPFGIGITTRVLYTSDPTSTVFGWYANYQRMTATEGHQQRRQLTIVRWTVDEAPDEDGTLITLYQQCADNLVLFNRQR